jgi:hypothetical protein
MWLVRSSAQGPKVAHFGVAANSRSYIQISPAA